MGKYTLMNKTCGEGASESFHIIKHGLTALELEEYIEKHPYHIMNLRTGGAMIVEQKDFNLGVEGVVSTDIRLSTKFTVELKIKEE